MKLLHGFIFIVLSFTLKTVVGQPYLDEIKAFASHLRAELASQDNDLGEEPGILASQDNDLGEEPGILASQDNDLGEELGILASQDNDLGEEPGILASQDNDLGEEPDMLTSQTDEGLRIRLDKLLPNNVSAMGNQVEDQGKLQY